MDADWIFIHWMRILDAERVNGKETDKEIAAYDLLLLVGLVSKREREDRHDGYGVRFAR